MTKKGNGKLGVKGAKNRKSEEQMLRVKAKKSVIENNKKEALEPQKTIRIKKGFLLVPKSKYLKNKEHYDNIDR